MTKRRKKGKQVSNKPFVFKVEQLIVLHPIMPSLDESVQMNSDKQQTKSSMQIKFIIALSLYIMHNSSLIQLFLDNWVIIEPLSQLVEWITLFIKLL